MFLFPFCYSTKYINLHGHNNVTVILNKYWWPSRVRYNRIWQYKFVVPNSGYIEVVWYLQCSSTVYICSPRAYSKVLIKTPMLTSQETALSLFHGKQAESWVQMCAHTHLGWWSYMVCWGGQSWSLRLNCNPFSETLHWLYTYPKIIKVH